MLIEPKVENSTTLLISRFNSHLTFNILNTLQYLVLEDEKEDAYRLIGSYSRILRSMLINGSTDTRVGDELTIIKDFLELERIRMDENFSYTISVPKHIQTLPLPKSVLISIIENAVKHGIRRLGSKAYIEIAYSGQGGRAISIINNAPVRQNISRGEGLNITRSLITKYNLLHGSSISLETKSYPQKGDPSISIFEFMLHL